MNYMEQVAQMLGVELEEEFKLKDGIPKTTQDDTAKIGKDEIFKITKDGIYGMFKYSEYSCDWNPAYHLLTGILLGRYEIIKEPILNEVEKEYLSNVIKPFRDRVEFIVKRSITKYDYIEISYREINTFVGAVCLPIFKENTIYKNMKINEEYTLEDLRL